MVTTDKKPIIEVSNLSKKFCTNLKLTIFYGAIDILSAFFPALQNNSLRKSEFYALKDVTLNLEANNILGIMGDNGSGKSTLLRIIAGIYEPNGGIVRTCGKVVSFLAAGTGFHPQLTVRENVITYGILLGIKECDIINMLDEIFEFADVKEFQNAPFATLSPGMGIRISFSVAIKAKPDILLIDEVLAVADEKFRKKAIIAIKALAKSSIVIFVSHNKNIIKELCDSILILQNGKVVAHNNLVEKTVDEYIG